MKKMFLLFAVVAALAGCASGVKLDAPTVEDRSGTAASSVSSLDARGMGGMNAGDIKPGPAGVSNVIYFDYDSFVVKPEFQSVLEAHARFMKANKNLRANLEGHTDERGGSEYNLALGQKRSEALRRALTVLGISDSQMEAVSYGKEKPAAQGADEAAFAKNRRAEIIYR
ncbi:MAG: putative peptidoglycan-associated lipoprotein precursor [Pseudomonadota bacterium]|jgi:peptidoglycan-associated lipoprotein